MCFTLITGASNGIGYELAKIFAKKGHHLILVARRENKLHEIAKEFRANHPIKALVIPQDVSQADAADKIFDQIKAWGVSVNNLVNNAGFYVQNAFSDTEWKKEQELIQLQCINHTKLVKLFLPEMLKRKDGGILNVCSTGSFMPGPYNAIYCAAKSFMLSFSEALAEELSGTGIRVTALCPGGTNTSFQKFDKRKVNFIHPLMKASVVAKSGYDAFIQGKRIIIPGMANKMQVFALRFLPRWLAARYAGKYMLNTLN